MPEAKKIVSLGAKVTGLLGCFAAALPLLCRPAQEHLHNAAAVDFRSIFAKPLRLLCRPAQEHLHNAAAVDAGSIFA